MPIDTSSMNPAEAAQVQMFEGLIDAMPTEALELLVAIIEEKIRERS